MRIGTAGTARAAATAVRPRFDLALTLLALLTAGVAAALVFSIMASLNGVIPDRDAPALLRTMMEQLLLNTLVLAWTALLHGRRV